MADSASQAPRRTIASATPADITECIKHLCGSKSEERKPRVTFLLGAGFSVSAGIPTAGMIIEDELRKHPKLKGKSAPPKDQSEYAYLMGDITAAERVSIIRGAVKKAQDSTTGLTKINWAHLLLAAMVAAGYVNKILTTNFDPLIVDTLALMGQPVRAFDLSDSQDYQSGLEPGTIVYLHGQAHGLWPANATAELEKVQNYLRPVFQDAFRDSIVIVVGYSGHCDPVLKEMTKSFRVFQHSLYWVHYDPLNVWPAEGAMELLAEASKGTFLVRGLDADMFMRELVLVGLQIELPPVVGDPFGYASGALRRILKFPQRENEPAVEDPVPIALRRVEEAVKSEEESKQETQLQYEIAMAGASADKGKLDQLRQQVERLDSVELRHALGDGYIQVVWNLLRAERFQEALDLVLDIDSRLGTTKSHEFLFLCAWGTTLGKLPRMDTGQEAEKLYQQAIEKLEEALRGKPDYPLALMNRGVAYHRLALIKTGQESEDLFKKAIDSHKEALRVKFDYHDARNNLASAYTCLARIKTGQESEDLYRQAIDRYEEALRIKPASCDTLFNLACLESMRRRTKEAVKYLRWWQTVDPSPTKKKLDDDKDFDPIRTEPEFIAFRESLPDA